MKKILFLGTMVVLFSIFSCRNDVPDDITETEWGDSSSLSYQGKTYPIKFFNQWWMLENLAWLPSVSPHTSESVTDPVYYVYDYEGASVIAAKATENYKKYGVLYNWAAAKTACPPGWHLPTDDEWKALESAFGMDDDELNLTSLTSLRESASVGYEWKSTAGWYGVLDEGNGRDLAGFNVLPAGWRLHGAFDALTFYAFFWTSTEYGNNAWTRQLSCWETGVRRDDWTRDVGMSVRCVKDQ